MEADICKAQLTLSQLNDEIDFQKNVLLKGICQHTNDVLVEFVRQCEQNPLNVDIDKIRIGTILTHDTMTTLYNALVKNK